VVVKWSGFDGRTTGFTRSTTHARQAIIAVRRLVEEQTKPKQRMSLAEMDARARWKNAPSAQELKDMSNRRS